MRALVLVLFCAAAARAQDAFEIQVYDASTAPPLTPGLEVHLNGVLHGSEQASPAGELPTHHVAHATLEPHLGLTDWLEVGAYLQSALRPEGTYDYAGTKLRMKARLLEPVFVWLSLAVTEALSLGAEYYAGLGPIDALLPLREQVHRGFGVVDLATRWLDLNLGIGGGSGPDSFIVKAIVAVHPPGG